MSIRKNFCQSQLKANTDFTKNEMLAKCKDGQELMKFIDLQRLICLIRLPIC